MTSLFGGMPDARLRRRRPPPPRIAALAIVAPWPVFTRHWERTPAGLVLPGGPDLRSELGYIRRSKAVHPSAPEGERLVRKWMPGDGPILVLTQSSEEQATEIIVRRGRPNALPINHPIQDVIVPDRSRPKLSAAIARLRPGTLMLVDAAPPPQGGFDLPDRKPLQKQAIEEIVRRFGLRIVARGSHGLAVVRLTRRGR